MANNLRNLEPGGSLYINSFQVGINLQRSPLFSPVSAMGIQLISRLDTLWDGLNIEVSSKATLQRRPGYSRYCSVQFGVSEFPLAFYSFKNLTGTIKAMVDTATRVATFTSSTLTTVFTKSTTAQTSFQKVGSMLYFADGTTSKKWNGTTVSNWGIAAPITAPTITIVPSGALSPTSGYRYAYGYKNSSTGHLSTLSALSGNTGVQTSKNFTIQGGSSADTQVDKVDIYRTDDGGTLLFYLATVNNGGTWSYTDNSPDIALNNDLVGPVAHINDPPPAGISVIAFHMGRFWAAAGNILSFGGGPDITNGVPEECFPPAYKFTLPEKITAMASTSNGLVVFTITDSYVVVGTDTVTFTVYPWQQNFGVPTSNALVQDGDLLFVFTSRGQLFQIGGTLEEIGHPIRPALAAFTAANVYLALHRSGTDEGLFVSDGSTNVWRYSLAQQIWSPVAQPVGGAKAIDSIEVTTGVYRLLAGRTAGSGFILGRDTTTFADDGTVYSGFVTVGSLMVAPPGHTTEVQSIFVEAMPVGTFPTLGVLLNEISGTFITLPNPINDPWEHDGTIPSTTVLMKRHDLEAAASPLSRALVRHLQIQLSFTAEAFQNEVIGIGVK